MPVRTAGRRGLIGSTLSGSVTIDPLKQRLHASLLRPAPSAADLDAARRLADAITPDGAWPDVDYTATGRFAWSASEHLERVLTLARARQFCSGELDAALTRAFDFWLARDLQAGNWWHDQIGVPRLVGATAFLCEAGLSAGAREKVIEILARSRWSHWVGGAWTDRTGANLLWIAHNALLRGCIENIPALCQGACERVYREVRAAGVGEEGLQADMSFHQGGALLHSGEYGLAFAENAARFFLLTHGTPWQAPAECVRLFAAFLLDGQQWMIRRGRFRSRHEGCTRPRDDARSRRPAHVRRRGRTARRRRRSRPAAPRWRRSARRLRGAVGSSRCTATATIGVRISPFTSARRFIVRYG